MDLCAQQPGIEPTAQGHIPLEQGLEGRGQDAGDIRGEEEGLIEGKENGDDIQSPSLNKHVLVHQRCTYCRHLKNENMSSLLVGTFGLH